jgi:DNA-directed RNA polymerase specialized sigma24 family protein
MRLMLRSRTQLSAENLFLRTELVATVFDISEDNVKARLHRARVALQKSLARADR